MLPGFNHNVKYKERVYHVQTEDSGVDNPHIITHLFFGGNIIFSLKTSYGDIVQSANLNELLVDLMQGQHKTMLKDLIKGRFDNDIAVRSVNAASLSGPAPLNVEAGAQHRVSLFGGMGDRSGSAGAAKGSSKGTAAAPAPEAASNSFFGNTAPSKIIEASALKDDKALDSIFGISEKSLDEVILSYLADDKR